MKDQKATPGTAKDKTAKDKRAEAEAELDEALEESFPASDPLPTNPGSAGAPDDHASAKGAKGGKG